jgi:hypothetical protein
MVLRRFDGRTCRQIRRMTDIGRHCCGTRRVERIDGGWQQPRPHLNSCDADGDRASQFQHLIQDMDADANGSVQNVGGSSGRW